MFKMRAVLLLLSCMFQDGLETPPVKPPGHNKTKGGEQARLQHTNRALVFSSFVFCPTQEMAEENPVFHEDRLELNKVWRAGHRS
jgi:hypothetical protein